MFWILLFLTIAQISAYNRPLKIEFDNTPTYTEGRMVSITNHYREDIGLTPLIESIELEKSAQIKADDLCRKQYWDHTSPDGTEFWELIDEAGYKYSLAGENLAKGYPNEKMAFKALLNSPSHYENIIGDYKNIGTGWSYCDGDGYIVMHYGKL